MKNEKLVMQNYPILHLPFGDLLNLNNLHIPFVFCMYSKYSQTFLILFLVEMISFLLQVFFCLNLIKKKPD
jgi:hypothetical protein